MKEGGGNGQRRNLDRKGFMSSVTNAIEDLRRHLLICFNFVSLGYGRVQLPVCLGDVQFIVVVTILVGYSP